MENLLLYSRFEMVYCQVQFNDEYKNAGIVRGYKFGNIVYLTGSFTTPTAISVDVYMGELPYTASVNSGDFPFTIDYNWNGNISIPGGNKFVYRGEKHGTGRLCMCYLTNDLS